MRRRGLVLVAALLGGCVAKQPYVREQAPLPPAWKAAVPAEAAAPDAPDLWWSRFGDPALPDLLRRARSGSLDLRAAAARTRAAADMVIVARARRLPELSIGAAPVDPAATSESLDARRDRGRYEVGLDARYELDLWRRVAATVDVARWEQQATALDAAGARTALEMAVAQTYFAIRRLDEASAIEARRAELAGERERLTELRRDAGRIAAADALEAREARREAQARRAGVARERVLAEQRLALLLGEAPESLSVPPAPLRSSVLAPVPPAGLPSSVLERRPDVRAAEARLASLHARIAVARAALFPQIVLTARLGFASDVLRDATPSLVYGFGPEVEYSVFDSGSREAELDASRWRREEALAEYRKAVLAALADVERVLLDYQGAVEAGARLAESAADRRGEVERLRGAIDAGRASRLDLLAAEDRALAASLTEVAGYAARLDALVALYQALGGGWDPGTADPVEAAGG